MWAFWGLSLDASVPHTAPPLTDVRSEPPGSTGNVSSIYQVSSALFNHIQWLAFSTVSSICRSTFLSSFFESREVEKVFQSVSDEATASNFDGEMFYIPSILFTFIK